MIFKKKKVDPVYKIASPETIMFNPVYEAYFIFCTRKRSEIELKNYPCAVAHCLNILETEGCQLKTDYLESLIEKYGEIKILASDYFDIIPRRENVITTTDVNGKEEVIL